MLECGDVVLKCGTRACRVEEDCWGSKCILKRTNSIGLLEFILLFAYSTWTESSGLLGNTAGDMACKGLLNVVGW